jgi:uncharacterized protein YjgD (DUF1641 family)
MAKPLEYRPEPVRDDTPDAALSELLAVLHERGVLRLLTNLARQSDAVAGVALSQLAEGGGKRLIDNALILAGALERADPEALKSLADSLCRGLSEVGETRAERPPSTLKLTRALGDPEVRRGLNAVLALLRALGRG